MNTKGIWTDKDRMSGIPCIRNTRFPVSQLIAELATSENNLSEICDNYELNKDMALRALQDVAIMIKEMV